MGRALYIEAVEDAAALAGGYEQLADELGVRTEEVKGWSAGSEIPEQEMFLRIIDLVTKTVGDAYNDRKAPRVIKQISVSVGSATPSRTAG